MEEYSTSMERASLKVYFLLLTIVRAGDAMTNRSLNSQKFRSVVCGRNEYQIGV